MFVNCLNAEQQRVLTAANYADGILLLTGNTGTGKTFLAKKAHELSSRRSRNKFTKINLATLSDNIIESELFGSEKGAFTGADVRRQGRLESSQGGTVFLDEIGELPLKTQAKLLDFLQYKKITPVGGTHEISLDVRIIAATNKDLSAMVAKGEFRSDLYYRLKVFHIHLEDLFVRSDYVADLIKYWNQNRVLQSPIADSIVKKLAQLPWPGNVRELENILEHACAMALGKPVQWEHFPSDIRQLADSLTEDESDDPSLSADCALRREEIEDTVEIPCRLSYHEAKDSFERQYIEKVLYVCGGQVNLSSRMMGLNKVSLCDKMKKYNIDWRQIKSQFAAKQRFRSIDAGTDGAPRPSVGKG